MAIKEKQNKNGNFLRKSKLTCPAHFEQQANASVLVAQQQD